MGPRWGADRQGVHCSIGGVVATSLGASDLREVVATYLELLRAHREVLNRLNVYPVPDGDTGTNMTLTVESVAIALAGLGEGATLEAVGQAIAHGSLMGARGNSGVILSQILRGVVEEVGHADALDAKTLAAALARADDLARQAVVHPVEGTILSIARAAARAAAPHADDLAALVRAARDAAIEALAHTPEQLPALAQAGVVDAGGSGLVLLLHALCHVVAGDAPPAPPPLESVPRHVHEVVGAGHVGPTYEVMFLLEGDDARIPALREVWTGLGESIVIVGGQGLYNCHIHTDDIGGALEASLDAGRPREVRVTNLSDQVLEERWVREATIERLPVVARPPAPATSVVAVVVGEGVGRIFYSLGVRELVAGGQSMNPATADLVKAVAATGSPEVVILPNNANVRLVAERVGDLVDQVVRVVPTDSVIEGFAALLAYDPAASAGENAAAMAASAAKVTTGEVTRAVRDAECALGPIRRGDWIGLGPGGVRAVADSVSGAARALIAALATPEHELVTLIEGDGASPANTRRITDYLAEEFPHLAVEVHHGGQPLYPYYLGLE